MSSRATPDPVAQGGRRPRGPCYGPAMPARRRANFIVVLALSSGCAIRAPAATEPAEITPRPTPRPTPTRSAAPATPSPTASPTADPALMDLEVLGCPGGVVLDWSPSTHPEFHHYIALRSRDETVPPDYPPLDPAVDWGDTFTTDRFVTAAVDASILPSDTLWHYRVMAYDARGRAVAASSVGSTTMMPAVELGELEASVDADDAVTLSWQPFDGPEQCFTAYRVLAGSGGGTLGTLTVVSDQVRGSLETDALNAGDTYQLRVQAVRTTTLGSFVLGQTELLTFTVP